MNWLRVNYQRVVALSAAAFLILSLVSIFLSAARFKDRFETVKNVPPPKNDVPSVRGAEIADALEQLKSPSQWEPGGRSGLFVPEKHFIGADGQPATLHDKLLHPPVPNEWLEEFGLPLTETDVLMQDADGDGFTNLDEWEGHTNPLDCDSRPPYVFKLKLRSFVQEMFPLIFSSSVEGTYAINSVDPRVPTQFLRIGEMIAGTKYRLSSYTEKYDTNKYGTTIDVSELVLEEVETQDRVTLVKERQATSPESVANFVYTWSGAERYFAVKKDQQFFLKPDEETKYKLLEVEREKAIIIDLRKPNEKIEVRPLKPP
jgi:hypothetical protein